MVWQPSGHAAARLRPRWPRHKSPELSQPPSKGILAADRRHNSFSTVTTVFCAACAMVNQLALQANVDIAVPISHRSVEPSTHIRTQRRQQHDRIVVAERIVDHLPVRAMREDV